ncbi:MAG: cytochrome d ubiquinol oxidase subunit II [Kineosporiaceae bacterium]|nr:cytochrome d ubiquinol oxidase subunit II [Kineosporiaceae bacterium]
MDIETLRIIWFALIAVLWTGYLVLEGFDFGVGMLLPVAGRTDTERRVLINTIGPVWDGNEVWLLTAGGATFAAFPLWYSTLFSAFYLPLLLILVALILRGVAFEYRGKLDSDTWRARWDTAIVVGSVLPSLLWGVAFGNIVRGVEADAVRSGPFAVLISALNPYALLTGATTLTLFLLHGALYLMLKTTDDLHRHISHLAARIAPVTLTTAAAWAIWTQLAHGSTWTWAAVAIAALALLGAVAAVREGREGAAFSLTSVVTVAAVVLIFGSLYPDVLPIRGGESLTIHTASSTAATLTVMTWVALALTPLVLAYQTWTYWTFRRRISTTDIPRSAGLPVRARTFLD